MVGLLQRKPASAGTPRDSYSTQGSSKRSTVLGSCNSQFLITHCILKSHRHFCIIVYECLRTHKVIQAIFSCSMSLMPPLF